jgi:hypothetical protein
MIEDIAFVDKKRDVSSSEASAEIPCSSTCSRTLPSPSLAPTKRPLDNYYTGELSLKFALTWTDTDRLMSRHHKTANNLTAVMGCGGSKEDAHRSNDAQVKPAVNCAVPQDAYAENAPPPPQSQQNGKEKKAVKAGKNVGLLSMLAG